MPVIEQLLNDSNDELSFTFKRGENLEQKSSKIPNSPGIYLVFYKMKSTDLDSDLVFTINNEKFILCNYGKGGGIKPNGVAYFTVFGKLIRVNETVNGQMLFSGLQVLTNGDNPATGIGQVA